MTNPACLAPEDTSLKIKPTRATKSGAPEDAISRFLAGAEGDINDQLESQNNAPTEMKVLNRDLVNREAWMKILVIETD